MATCFHCGLPADDTITAEIEGQNCQFCCYGCLAVAQAIHAGGLDGYYRFRDRPGVKPVQQQEDYHGYDLPEVQAEFVSVDAEGRKTARLNVQGISCAACAWLIEKHLSHCEGVESVRVNATNRTCLLRWDDRQQPLSALLNEFQYIGYRPHPDRQEAGQSTRRKESQWALMRLGVAGIGMMQVGMVAVALYAGDLQGIERHWEIFLRWVSLVIATPVVLFSAQPFFKSAIRSLRARHLTMDVSVSLAIGLAYAASVWATLTHTGDVYFDSVSMFTFFLLLGRYLEMRARHSSAFASESLQHLLPFTATRIDGQQRTSVPLASLQAGMRVWVDAGAVIPADGKLVSGFARVDESLLTGEAEPQQKSTGSTLVAGTLNSDTGFEMVITEIGAKTQLAAIERLVTEAALDKPRQVAIADRVAGWFVAAVLLIALLVAAVWWQLDSSKALWVTLSVLVVTCPCALSLAMPAVLTAGINRARKMGLLISGAQTMELLSTVSMVVFDKTGTLTHGKMQLKEVVPLGDIDDIDAMLDILAALERHSRHPIARAFKDRQPVVDAEAVTVVAGEGIQGRVDGHNYRFGRLDFAMRSPLEPPSTAGLWQLLSKEHEGRFLPVAWVGFMDELRASAKPAIQALKQHGVEVALLSGDREAPVADIANYLGITRYRGLARPKDKLNWLQEQQAKGYTVLMVGDGINDVPVLSAADVSMAMGSATRLAQSKADSILLSGNLAVASKAITLSLRVQKIVRQNLSWALLYNAVALPVAIAGWVPPWLAAIGMSASSLIVVLNAMRV